MPRMNKRAQKPEDDAFIAIFAFSLLLLLLFFPPLSAHPAQFTPQITDYADIVTGGLDLQIFRSVFLPVLGIVPGGDVTVSSPVNGFSYVVETGANYADMRLSGDPVSRIHVTDWDGGATINVDSFSYGGFRQAYAIDASGVNSATATITAAGNALYKCANWDFNSRTCNGEWVFVQEMRPGSEYEIGISPGDPAYGENLTITNVAGCMTLNNSNEVYNLTQDIGCSGSCTCIHINASNVSLRCNGFNIDGSGYTFPPSVGINISSVSDTWVVECNITEFMQGVLASNSNFSNVSNNTFSVPYTGTGIYVTMDSDNNTLSNNSFTGISTDSKGIVVDTSSGHNMISGNTFRLTYSGAIYLSSPDNNLTNNDMRYNTLALFVAPPAGVPCRNHVDPSNMAGNSGDPIHFAYDQSGATIENNASFGEILLCNVSNSIIRNITMADDTGLVLSSSALNQIYNNSLGGGQAARGIYLYDSDSNAIYNNTISYTNNSAVELFSGSDHNLMCNNTFSAVITALNLVSSSNNTFCNAQISAITGGIIIQQSSSNNTIQNATLQPAPESPFGTTYGIGISFSAYDNKISNFTANISNALFQLGGISLTDGPTSGNVFTDCSLYTISSPAIRDINGGDTFVNTYLHSSSGNFISAAAVPNSFANLTIAKDGTTVNFPGAFSMSNFSNSSNTIIASDFISINSSSAPELNQTANVTTYTNLCAGANVYGLAGFPSSRSAIISGGTNCTSCNILSCAGSTIRFDVPEFTGYAAGVPLDCPVISAQGAYTQPGEYAGSTHAVSAPFVGTACVLITASNVLYDCNGYGITGNVTNPVNPTYGIFINQSSNVTVRNCPSVSNYSYGAFAYMSADSAFSNVAGHGNFEYGLTLYASNRSNVTDSLAYANNNSGIVLTSAKESTIANNIVHSNRVDGFFISFSFPNPASSGNRLINNTAYNSSTRHGFSVWSSENNTFEGNAAFNNPADSGFYLSSSSNNSLSNNTAYGNMYGFRLISGSNRNNLSHNSAHDCSSAGFLLGSNSNNALSANTARNITYGFYMASSNENILANNTANRTRYGFYSSSSSRNNFTGNTAFNSSGAADSSGFYLTSSTNNTLLDNTAQNNTNNGFYLYSNCNYNTVLGNTAYGNPWYGIYLYSNHNNTVSSNTVYGNGQGIQLYSSLNNSLLNNTAYGNYYGIYLASSSNYNVLHSNTAYGNTGDGIQLQSGSNHNTVFSNTAHHNTQSGFYLYSSTAYNNLTNNTAYNNANGIFLYSAQNCTVTGNAAYNNSYSGLRLYQSSDNTFSGNALPNNSGSGIRMYYYCSNNTFIRTSITNTVGNATYLDSWCYDNKFIGTSIRNSSGYGAWMVSLSSGNNFTDTIIINQSRYIFQQATAASPNSFVNLTLAYNETVGIVNYFSIAITRLDLMQPATIIIMPDWVSLNDESASAAQANASANITINNSNCATFGVLRAAGFPTSLATILSSGLHYATTKSCSGDIATFNVSGFSGYSLGQQTSACTLVFDPPASPQTYGTPINASCSCTNLDGELHLWRNGSNADAENGVPTLLPGGTWDYTCNVTATGNYTNASTSALYTISRAATAITFQAIPGTPIIYGIETNVSGAVDNPQVEITIYRNGTAVAGPGTSYLEYLTMFAAGSYELVCNTSGNENYTAASETIPSYVVGKADPSALITFDAVPGWAATAGEEVNISCNSTTPQITLELWNETGLIGTGQNVGFSGTFTAGSYNFTCNSSETENYTASSQVQTLVVSSAPVPPSGGAREEPQLFITAPEEVFQGEEMLIVVQREGGGTMPIANVVIRLGTSIVFDGYTDTWGRVFFTPASTGTYSITATKPGFQDARDSFTVLAPAPQCTVDGDCAYNERCVAGNCTLVPPGECGTYANHLWADYACCGDSDCAQGYECRNHECVREEQPTEEERCSSDSDCPSGFRCTYGACVLIPAPGCLNDSSCPSGYECREGECIPKEAEEIEEGGEAVEGAEQPGLLQDVSGFVAKYYWVVLLIIALLIFFLFFWGKRRKKKKKHTEDAEPEKET